MVAETQHLGLAAEAQNPAQHLFKAAHFETQLDPCAFAIQAMQLLCRVPAPFLGQLRA